MTKICDLLRAGPTFSFEFMPPRTPEREVQLEATLTELEPLHPSFVSITYGAAGSTRERTHDLVRQLLQESSMTPMAHLTCAAHSKAELTEILRHYTKDGLQNILALRGDPPLDALNSLPEGEFHQAIQLVELAREINDFCVAVAMHPEGHPHAPDTETDLRVQASKLKAADFGITQFFFRSEDYFRFIDELAKRGATNPVIPGIMPPTNVAQLAKMAELSGTDVPAEVVDALTTVKDNPEMVRRVGVEIATTLCQELLDGGVPGLHFFTMNRSTATREIYANLGLGT